MRPEMGMIRARLPSSVWAGVLSLLREQLLEGCLIAQSTGSGDKPVQLQLLRGNLPADAATNTDGKDANREGEADRSAPQKSPDWNI